ncbi:MAG TPA: hypothetical protein VG847_14050 [Chitinophagaceae bacterium]|nr:hypothetical protein [Chitinophagaceae bacterium]
MLEIIALIFLSREIGRLAYRKGVKASTWKIYFIVGWFVLEIIGVVVGLLVFSQDNFFSIELLALAFAISSYFITKAQLNKMPDVDDDIDHIGQS